MRFRIGVFHVSDPVNVTVIPNGPLKVANARNVRFCGQKLEVEGDLYLCRCGASSKAPFCDGTHGSNGFDGGCEDPPGAEVQVWEGKTVRTRFNKAACMHVFHCKPMKELRAAELEGDEEAAVEILRVVASCPSGALTAEAKTDLPDPEITHSDIALRIVEGGEVRIDAEFVINAPLQEGQPSDKATLCRCGDSRNKPWCDGRH
jgi:CDGSH-type Zn-finger protein